MPVHQHVPAREGGDTRHHHTLSNGYSLPDGIMSPMDGGGAVRRGWTEEPLEIRPRTWLSDNVLKYTANEIMARGRQAEHILARAQEAGSTRTVAATRRALNDLGVTGMPLFSTLSYFKCVPPVPHI